MRKLWFLVPLLLCSLIPARGQVVVGGQILAGNNLATPAAVATDSQGFVYVAGSTYSIDLPVTNALEAKPPQGVLEVSIDGGPFVNADIDATTFLNENGISGYGEEATAVAASSDGKLVLAAAGQNLYRSIDGGVTWTAVEPLGGGVSALAVDPANPSIAYALNALSGGLFQSTDGGLTWQAHGSPPNIALTGEPDPYWFPPADSMVIDPQNPAALYVWCGPGLVMGPETVYRSTGSGQSWQQVPINQVAAFALAPSQPNMIYALSAGVLFRSTDGGFNWTAGASFNYGYIGGSTYAFQPVLAVDPADPSTVWVTAPGSPLQESTDGGATLQTITPPGDSSNYANTSSPIAIDPANHLQVYFSTGSGVWATSDGGATWSTVFPGYAWSLYAAPSRIFLFGGGIPPTVFLAKLDPALSRVVYCTYLWTGQVSGIAVDGQGNVALTGSTTAGPGIVMKVHSDDSAVIYSTLISGAQPNAIAMDAEGNSAIAGSVTSLAATKGPSNPRCLASARARRQWAVWRNRPLTLLPPS
jgi:photosystem II stability/assembly factor-like uncharacterized protein